MFHVQHKLAGGSTPLYHCPHTEAQIDSRLAIHSNVGLLGKECDKAFGNQ